MQDFYFYNTTKLLFGRNHFDNLKSELERFGRNVLFVYGKQSIHSNGLYERINGLVKAEGELNIIDHGGVSSNPILSHVQEGVRKAKANNIDCILAVGGGSVIDEAKVIAAGYYVDHDVWDFFNGKKPQKALPIVSVLTIAATGSEMNGGAVITNDTTNEKKGIGAGCLYPQTSIVDPQLTTTVSRDYTVYGLVDVMSHIFESYFNGSSASLAVQDNMAEGLMRAVIDVSIPLLEDLHSYEKRADMMWAATMAFQGCLIAGRGSIQYDIHQIAHAIGGLYNVAHGAALAFAMPRWMKMKLSDSIYREKIARFAVRVMDSEKKSTILETAKSGIDLFVKWLREMNAPVDIKSLGIRECDIPDIANKVEQLGGISSCDAVEVKKMLLDTNI